MTNKFIKKNIDNRRKHLKKQYLKLLNDCVKNKKFAKSYADTLSMVSANLISRSLYSRHKENGIYPYHQILIGVGTEALLKAIILSKFPNKLLTDPDMRFEKAKIEVNKIIKNDNLKDEIKQTISGGLDLIQFKRNWYGHASFGGIDTSEDNFLILKTLDFLYSTYFPQRKSIIKKIKKFEEIYR
jgi:hypothetical protein